MPPAESIPAICQFGLASRSAGKMPPPNLAGDATSIATSLWALAANATSGGSAAGSRAARKNTNLTEAHSLGEFGLAGLLLSLIS